MAHKKQMDTESVDSGNSPATSGDAKDFIFDYKVLDREGDKIGTVNDLWPNVDGSGYSFIGVHTGWLIGKNHVVPADGMEIDHEERHVRLPLSKEAIKAAPDFDVSDEILAVDRDKITGYYGGDGETDTMRRDSTPDTMSKGITDKDADVVDVAIREEKVKVGKRQVEAGNVRLRRVVRTETVNVPVELRQEDVIIERVSAGEGTGDTGSIGEKEIVIPISREEPVVEKTTEVTGVVRARKTVDHSSESVSETVRKEDVEVDRDSSRATPGNNRGAKSGRRS